jgi:hypothetical protein
MKQVAVHEVLGSCSLPARQPPIWRALPRQLNSNASPASASFSGSFLNAEI